MRRHRRKKTGGRRRVYSGNLSEVSLRAAGPRRSSRSLSSSAGGVDLFHERQKRAFCGLHAVNNCLQYAAFEPADFDALAGELVRESGLINAGPCRCCCGGGVAWSRCLGNYDANVLLYALESKSNIDWQWLDQRTDASEINFALYHSILVNRRPKVRLLACLLPCIPSRHWYTVYRGECLDWFNLDSKLPRPALVGDVNQFVCECQARGDEIILLQRRSEKL